MTITPAKPVYNFIIFAAMFIACILGSIGIFVFAVGMETGNTIVEGMMKSLVEHAAVVIGVFVAFNLFILAIYWNRKGQRS